MDQLLTQLMAGGILAILVIREVLTFLKTKQNHKEELGLTGLISREEFERHKAVVRYKDVCDVKHEAIKDSLDRIEGLIRNGRGT